MKIRQGFVSNSSSSSFIIAEDINLEDLKTVKTFDLSWMTEEEIENEKKKLIKKINCSKNSIRYKINDDKDEYLIEIDQEAIKKYIQTYGKKYNIKKLYIEKIKEEIKRTEPYYLIGYLKSLINIKKINKNSAEIIMFISFLENSLISLKNAYYWLRRYKKYQEFSDLFYFYRLLNTYEHLDYLRSFFINNEKIFKLLKEKNDDFSDFNDICYIDNFEKFNLNLLNKVNVFKKEFSKFIKWYQKAQVILTDEIFDRKILSILVDLFFDDSYFYYSIKKFLETQDLNDSVYELFIQGSGEGYNDLISYILYDIGRDKWIKNQDKIFIFE